MAHQKLEAIIFDLDGTLFQTETLLLPAYHATFQEMREQGIYQGDTPPDELILGGLGLLLAQIWDRVIPEASREVRQYADKLLLHYQLEGLKKGQGQLFAGVADTLSKLKNSGIRLFVASNGLEQYVKGVVETKGLSAQFEAVYSAGEFLTASKVDLVRMLLNTYGVHTAWMVGDRSSDVEAGKKNKLTVVGCEYARFSAAGELDGADLRIKGFSELLDHIDS